MEAMTDPTGGIDPGPRLAAKEIHDPDTVAEALELLNRELDELANRIGGLQERLGTVLVPAPAETGSVPHDTAAPPGSDLRIAVQLMQAKVVRLSRNVGEIHHRVDL